MINFLNDCPLFKNCEGGFQYDIALALNSANLKTLSDGVKYQILTSTPTDYIPKDFKFPPNNERRQCSYEILAKDPFLRYSPSQDGVFCVYYYIIMHYFLAPKKIKKLLETRKRLEQCGQNFYQTCKVPTRKHHATTHQLCVSKAEGFIKVFQGQQFPIIAKVDNQRKLKVTNNRHVLTEILKPIHLLGKQNIAIRGKTDERSNFIVFLKARAEKDVILAEHLNSIKARKEAGFKKVKGAYTSHQIQNEGDEVIEDMVEIIHDR